MDNFRINSSALRKVEMVSSSEEKSQVWVEYHSNNKFSAYNYNPVTDERSIILSEAEIMINPEDKDQLILCTAEN